MDPLFSIWWGLRISYTMINYVMHICVDKSLEFSYHMFNCNCCKIWWMFFLWTLFVQLNIVANLFFACWFKLGYFCLFVQLNIVVNLLFCMPVQNAIFFICSVEYCVQFALCVPIQNGIFLFICSIEYCGKFDFCVPIQNGIFLF